MPTSRKRHRANSRKGPTRAKRPPSPSEPVSSKRISPEARRALGWIAAGFGGLVVVVNWIAELGVDIMPGGHNRLYFLGGLGVAGAGAVLLGVFSQPAR